MELGTIVQRNGLAYSLTLTPPNETSCCACHLEFKSCNYACGNRRQGTHMELVGTTESISPYPKVMMVRQNTLSPWQERVVLMKKKDLFIAWGDATTIEKAEESMYTHIWKFAKDIEPEPVPTELTMQEIADKFGVSVDNLKIKK